MPNVLPAPFDSTADAANVFAKARARRRRGDILVSLDAAVHTFVR